MAPDQTTPPGRHSLFKDPAGPFPANPLAFWIALVTSPILTALCGFWAFLIPVFALIFGGPLYLVIGGPLLWWHLRRRRANAKEIALLALITNLLTTALVVFPIILIANPMEIADYMFMFGGIGSIFACLWGATFAGLYNIIDAPNRKTP